MGIVGGFIKACIYTSVVAVAGILYYTKPTDESLNSQLSNIVQTDSLLVNAVAGVILPRAVNKDIRDFLFFKIAILSIGTKKQFALGILTHWFFHK